MQEYIILENNFITSIIDASGYSDNKDNIINILQGLLPDKVIIKRSKDHINVFTGCYYINDNFIQPRPFKSWILKNNEWHSPKPYPQDNKTYYWNEINNSWKILGDSK
jgi:hypothetical protein